MIQRKPILQLNRRGKPTLRFSARKRVAVAAVEFAFIAPIMMLFTFGLIEIGRFMMVKNQAVQATREGARMAIRPTANVEDVKARVEQNLQALAIFNATIETEPLVLSSATPGSLVTVRVRIDPRTVSWVPGFMDNSIPDMVVETVMRRESTE